MDNVFEISIDYAKTIMQAEQLNRIAGQCRDTCDDIKKEISRIESIWEGKSAGALCEKLAEVQTNCHSVSVRIDTIAYNMKRVANAIKQADIESIERIKKFKI